MARIIALIIFILYSLMLRGQQNESKKTDSTKYFSSDANDPIIKRITKEKKFYDSILSAKKYHAKLHGKLTNGRFRFGDGRFKSKDARFKFKTDRGYVVSNSAIIRTPSSDPRDFIGGDINQISSGNRFVILLHYQYCVGESDHACTNYSITLELPTLNAGDLINLSSPNAFATLGYWHFGSFSGPENSVSYSGEVKIVKSGGGQVAGKLKCSFKNSDKTGFEASGNFFLPIIDRAVIEKFNQEINK